MHYLVESLFVGTYSWMIYKIVQRYLPFSYALFGVVGFLKHMCSYWIGLQSYYCKHGYACQSVYRIPSNHSIVLDSLAEGGAYLVLGSLLMHWIRSKGILFFILGVLLHLLSEAGSIHTNFCKNCQSSIRS